jgi:D-alanyl-D-alanine carboxypeptidase
LGNLKADGGRKRMTCALPPPPSDYAARMPRVPEAPELVSVGPDYLGRDALLTPQTAVAWNALQTTANSAGIALLLISAFSSVQRQTEILTAKLAKGLTLERALEYSAYPGFSEHHSGEAIDIGTPGSTPLEEEFETTPAFHWLRANASAFGFALSYPRGNPFGVAYEPWHWRYRAL